MVRKSDNRTPLQPSREHSVLSKDVGEKSKSYDNKDQSNVAKGDIAFPLYAPCDSTRIALFVLAGTRLGPYSGVGG